ncbi:hypothetical protein DH2020_024255 [Rehmannia glutinosa]|uniref:F-actin-capping protein subunit alpha n=1 Tax=Rehmannia glutinosa TaxID=99300 RepID=A0ABR0WC82_REHGL
MLDKQNDEELPSFIEEYRMCALDAEIIKYVRSIPKGVCSVYCVNGKDVEEPGSDFELVVVISAARHSPQNFWYFQSIEAQVGAHYFEEGNVQLDAKHERKDSTIFQKLPQSFSITKQIYPRLVELKNGETYNGHLVNCDTWMNIHLREVICTSKDGDRFWRMPECYIRGNTIKYLRVPDEVIDKVQEEKNRSDRRPPGVGRGRGRGRDDTAAGRQSKGIGRGIDDGASKSGGRGKGVSGSKSSGNRDYRSKSNVATAAFCHRFE